MNRVALVEDHERMAELVCRALAAAGIEVEVFDRISTAQAAVTMVQYSALIVDRGLPDGEGLDLVRSLRERGIVTPCLMLTARNAVHDRIDGLEQGADDYLTKPFSMDELVARVRALLRRPPIIQTLTPEFKGVQLLPDQGLMVVGEERVSLAPAEMQIMLVLVRSNDQIIRRAAVETAAWGLNAVTPNALDVAVHRLRKKLAAIGATVQLTNVRGRGYTLRDVDDET